jgi:N-acetylglucosamine kinase-like BadF-type ATPase
LSVVIGVDGGNSKVDVALVDETGRLLAARRGATVSHQAVDLETGMNRLSDQVQKAAVDARVRLPVDLVVASLAGADYAHDVRLLGRSIDKLGLAQHTVVVNDTIGALRAGASQGWGVALVCGQGINAAAIAPNGRQLRFPGVGDISGDWGGGGGVGMAGLQAAVRGSDGRGPRTSLEHSVPTFFGLRTPAAVTRAFYFGRLQHERISSLAPLVFADAAAGDAVARGIVDRLDAELAGMATALIRRLHLRRLEVLVVLAGGVFRTRDEDFYRALETGIRATAPRARLVHLDAPPVAGAVLLALDELAAGAGRAAREANSVSGDVRARLRDALRAWDQAQLSKLSG